MQLKGSYKEIWQISYPIILGSLAHSINQLIDTAYLGHSSKIALDAITLAGIYYYVFIFIAGGLARGCQVIIARYNGEGNDQKSGTALDNLFVIGFILSLILMVFFYIATPSVLQFAIKSKEIQNAAITYISMMNFAVIPVVIGFCFNGFFTGIGKTKIISVATICMTLTNIIFGYIFIFGKFGFPALGIKGAGIATAIADTVLCLVYVLYFFYKKYHTTYKALTFKTLQLSQMWNIIRLSIPIVLQNMIGIVTWWYFFLSLEKIGEHELAVSGIIKSIFIFIGIPVWSLASTSNTIVSNIIGQNRIEDVTAALKKVVIFSVSISFTINFIIILFPIQIFSIFTNDVQVIKDAIPPFYTLMIAMLFFSTGMVLNFGITGTGATFVPTIIEIICSISYLSYCYFFIRLKQSPLYICWGCEIVYWTLVFATTTIYWRSDIWRKHIKTVS